MGARVFVYRCSARVSRVAKTTSARVPSVPAARPTCARASVVVIVASPAPLHVSVRESRGSYSQIFLRNIPDK